MADPTPERMRFVGWYQEREGFLGFNYPLGLASGHGGHTIRAVFVQDAKVEEVQRVSSPVEIAAAHDALIAALAFYADPGTYHAAAFWFDPPTGGFDEDFDENHGDDFYERPMPGAQARAALAKWFEATRAADS